MTIAVEKIKALREQTGISVGACKQALERSDGDVGKALESLREQGAIIAGKKAARALGAGIISAYIHSNHSLGALLELDCETDFVAKNSDFRVLGEDLAMHVSAFVPADLAELLAQPFIKDASVTVADVVRAAIHKFGEKIEIVRFSRYNVGAGA